MEESKQNAEPQPFYTVGKFAKRHKDAFTDSSLRNLIFKAEDRESSRGPIQGNGLFEAGAITRCGRKVLIHEARFFAWIENRQAAIERERLRNGGAA